MDKLKDLNIKYKIYNPGGNKTALVIGNEYTKNEKKVINNTILQDNKDVEQIGFISTKENKLEMAGGEFCANASRCAVWEYLNGKKGEILLDVSGISQAIIGGITENKEVFIKMSVNKRINNILKNGVTFSFIDLDGILITIIDEINSKEYLDELRKNDKETKNKLKEIMKNFKSDKKAVGIILLEKEKGKLKINPIVWVKEIDTLFYETACGSGSLATAIYEYDTEGIEKIDILQPSGYSINVKLELEKDIIKNAIISGKVFKEE